MTRQPCKEDINTILVPTDGFECSEKAVSLAGNLAKKLAARVHVLFISEAESTWRCCTVRPSCRTSIS